ncbi:MAG: tRNA (cytidine(34)-2'-O)-methyltransferase [Desulfatibacillaceae bacterium]|nr:tRNA (cytidine(34)-2'-O)-methyltransferase [Desulfatibacillaceae bacterium]
MQKPYPAIKKPAFWLILLQNSAEAVSTDIKPQYIYHEELFPASLAQRLPLSDLLANPPLQGRSKKATIFDTPVCAGFKTARNRFVRELMDFVERNVVLVHPQIHWNTGNIGRTCLAVGAALHLVRPLGFSLESAQVKRAGLDYWHEVNLALWDDFETLVHTLNIDEGQICLFTKNGELPHWEIPQEKRLFLVFGSETGGLPGQILEKYPKRTFYIPMPGAVRSLNLSTAAGIGIYESLRGMVAGRGINAPQDQDAQK